MASLKAFLPELAKVVDTTADALYSRQRALTQIGLLKAINGRGPGSGVALSGDAVAAMIIALMTSDTLQETDDRVRRICFASPADGSTCPWTDSATFQSALAAVLLSPQRVRILSSISVSRDAAAWIAYHQRGSRPSAFINKQRVKEPVIKITARMDSTPLRKISNALRSALGNPR